MKREKAIDSLFKDNRKSCSTITIEGIKDLADFEGSSTLIKSGTIQNTENPSTIKPGSPPESQISTTVEPHTPQKPSVSHDELKD